MKLIYVAGKYYSKSYSEISDNIRRAEKVSLKLLMQGWCFICPHKNSSHMEVFNDFTGFGLEQWLELDFEILRRCDAIFMMKHYEQSKGSNMEMAFAKKNSIPIFFETDGFPKPEQVTVRC